MIRSLLFASQALVLGLGLSAGCTVQPAPEPVNPAPSQPSEQPGEQPSEPSAGDPQPGKACVRGGCSSQLCLEEGNDMATDCMYREVYACYKTATCERQADGACGWTETAELTACIQSHQSTPVAN